MPGEQRHNPPLNADPAGAGSADAIPAAAGPRRDPASGPPAPAVRALQWIGVPLLVLAAVAGALGMHAAQRPSTGRTPASGVPTGSAVPRELSASEIQSLHSAEQRLVAECMSRHGFRYWPNPLDPVPELRDFPYVVDDLDWARRHGYGSQLQRRMDEVLEASPNRRYARGLTPARRAAYLDALNGTPDAGAELTATLPSGLRVRRSARSCVSWAQRALYADLPTWYRAVKVTDALPPAAYALAQRDNRLRAAVERWSGCMRAAGHPYANPAQARAAVSQAAPSAPSVPSAQEIRLAVAEATCARRTGLASTARTVDRDQLRELQARHRTEVIDRWRLSVAALPRAREVLDR